MLAAALVSLVLALPQHAVVVPGKSFAGLRLGATAADVRAAWGNRFGRCRNCAQPTWYFTYKQFQPQGAGVAFRTGHAAAFFTTWSPAGWRTDRGVTIGDPAARVTAVYGVLPRVECGTYAALVLRRGRTDTQFYLYDEKVWGFGLSRAGAPPCR
ncbi:MAG TPA: hypothetical protein VJT84_01335 [Gaiellaceae bacterium]|nr:hypothetical protein [Gaiellaceae bacterium]